MKLKPLKIISGIFFHFATAVFGLSVLASFIMQDEQIEALLSDNVFEPGHTDITISGKPPIRYKTWYQSIDDVLNGNDNIAKAAESEGVTLLKNANNALPLKSGDKVSLFGVTAYDPIYSLDGAGEVKINADRQEFFDSEFKQAGLDINEELANWYKNQGKAYYRNDVIDIYGNGGSNGVNAELKGANWSVLPASKLKDGYKTAIFITGRITNEGVDIMPGNVSDPRFGAKDGDYLKFSDNEISVLNGIKEGKANEKFDKAIVIFNQANPVQENLPKLLKEYNIDAAIWMGFPGSAGITAVADILTGKVSPSGGLSTTWYANRDSNPSTPYFSKKDNVLIQENIYSGYKYAETRYEDYVLSNEHNGDYIYQDHMSYPFGYGESYAKFEKEIVSLELDKDPSKNYQNQGLMTSNDVLYHGNRGSKLPLDERRHEGDDYILKVKVKNTSDFPAKEIVQVYVNKPYSQLDKEHGVENASVELVAFAKTKKLAKNEEQILEIKIDANKTFASYDGSLKTYTIEAGDYLLSVARNSHEAVNNILKYKKSNGVNVDETKMDTLYGAGNKAFVSKVSVSQHYANNYDYWTQGGAKVKNLFDLSDPNIASGNANLVKYMSRNNWVDSADNAKNQTFGLTGNMTLMSQIQNGNNFNLETATKFFPELFEKFSETYPNYGLNREPNKTNIQLSKMIGVEYDPKLGATKEDIELWNKFLDQLTWEETAYLVSHGFRSTPALQSIGKPYTYDLNASNAIASLFSVNDKGGFGYYFDPVHRNKYPTGYPCEGIIAATFNIEVAKAVGNAIGEDGLWSGASGLYGFGLGLHRNPYHGRAGEYYSDDPYLTGMMGGYESKGAQEKGMYVYNKHFILNDQETSRTSYKTWLNEQTFRETYLRTFEIAIEIGDAMNVMNSFNNIGSGWSGNNYNLMTACLREELGMRGFAVTDYFPSGGMNLKHGILAGTDLPDGNAGYVADYGPNNKFGENWAVYAHAVRQSAQRILYTVANSAAMNFIGENTQITVYPAAWIAIKDKVLVGIYSTYGVIAGIYVLLYGFINVKEYIDYIKSRKIN